MLAQFEPSHHPGGLLFIDASKTKAEEILDVKYLLRTSDPEDARRDFARPFGSIRMLWANLRTGASQRAGTGRADGVLFTQADPIVQRATGTLVIWDMAGRRLLRSLPGAGGGSARGLCWRYWLSCTETARWPSP